MKSLTQTIRFRRFHVTTTAKLRITNCVLSERRSHPFHGLGNEPNRPLVSFNRTLSDVCHDHDTYCMTFRETTWSQTGVYHMQRRIKLTVLPFIFLSCTFCIGMWKTNCVQLRLVADLTSQFPMNPPNPYAFHAAVFYSIPSCLLHCFVFNVLYCPAASPLSPSSNISFRSFHLIAISDGALRLRLLICTAWSPVHLRLSLFCFATPEPTGTMCISSDAWTGIDIRCRRSLDTWALPFPLSGGFYQVGYTPIGKMPYRLLPQLLRRSTAR